MDGHALDNIFIHNHEYTTVMALEAGLNATLRSLTMSDLISRYATRHPHSGIMLCQSSRGTTTQTATDNVTPYLIFIVSGF
jgi:hypothetical protein